MRPTTWVKATGPGEGEDEPMSTKGFKACVIVVVPMEWSGKYRGGGFPPPPVQKRERNASCPLRQQGYYFNPMPVVLGESISMMLGSRSK